MQELPPYFKEYMEQKFSELHARFDSTISMHKDKFEEIEKDVSEIKKDTRWLNQKVWMAIGALGVISIAGGVLASSFKLINKQQIQEAIQPLQEQTKKAQETAQNTDNKLQGIINNYKLEVQ